jgi:hypothetical protein
MHDSPIDMKDFRLKMARRMGARTLNLLQGDLVEQARGIGGR